jgi:hypothetical protein
VAEIFLRSIAALLLQQLYLFLRDGLRDSKNLKNSQRKGFGIHSKDIFVAGYKKFLPVQCHFTRLVKIGLIRIKDLK